MTLHRVQILDVHVAGEPVRVIVGGGPDLASGPLLARQARLKATSGHFRRAMTSEPRGSELLTCAMLCAPHDPRCQIGALFFDADGWATQPGHAVIGLIAALAHRGDLKPGDHRIDTPQGALEAALREDGTVTLQMEACRRHSKDIAVEIAGRTILGDLAWAGEWFFLTENRPVALTFANLDALTAEAAAIRAALIEKAVPEAATAQIAFLGEAPGVFRRNLALRANGRFDRSPGVACAAAKIACLAEDASLTEQEALRFQSVVGGLIDASYARRNGEIRPQIHARPRVYAETAVILDPSDPFCWGFPI